MTGPRQLTRCEKRRPPHFHLDETRRDERRGEEQADCGVRPYSLLYEYGVGKATAARVVVVDRGEKVAKRGGATAKPNLTVIRGGRRVDDPHLPLRTYE